MIRALIAPLILLSLYSDGGGRLPPAPEPVEIAEVAEERVYQSGPFYQTEENPIRVPADDDEDLIYLARTVWGEVGSVKDRRIQEAVAWTVLNHVDHPYYPDTVKACVTQRLQFTGYHAYLMPWEAEGRLVGIDNGVVTPEVVEICRGVLTIWYNGLEGRVLPPEYLGFCFGENREIKFYKNKRADAVKLEDAK